MGSISKDIVIVNEFTVRGSRGFSPDRYVLEYMARDNASENLTPTIVRSDRVQKLENRMTETFKRERHNQAELNLSDYVLRYMARETATEFVSLDGATKTSSLKSEFEELQGYAGVAFGPDCLSLSHEDVREKSKMIKREFDKGKPVLKTVISFDTEYLKRMGVLPSDFDCKKRGDMYGKSDQAKLRLAIQHGLENIKHEFSDLDYIGVIQVDTMHIHCHLAMVDKGTGKRFASNGEQKGMISDRMKLAMRRGIDNSLQQSSLIKPLSIQMESERRNTISFIKRFTYKVMEERGISQYLLACLPKDDKSLWKADLDIDGGQANIMTVKKGKTEKPIRGNMKKANEIVRSYVIDLLNRPDSGFTDAMRIKHDYLMAQKNRGDFDDYYTYSTVIRGKKKQSVKTKVSSEDAVRIEEEKFRESVIKKGMNSVYDILKTIDDKTINLHTPFMDAMSMPYEDMASFVKDDKLIEFGFRLRSYSSRLEYHKDKFNKVNKIIHQYEDGDIASYSPEARNVYDFLKIEQEYDHSLMCKYQTFLHFYHIKDEYKDEYEDLMYLRHKTFNREAMKNDKSLKKSKPENAEEEGMKTYGLAGGQYLVTNPALFNQLQVMEEQEYARALRNFKERLATYGLMYDEEKDDVFKGLEYDFDDVKAYDLHHMTYDYTYDFKIAEYNVQNFIKMADKRYDAYNKANEFLVKTGQADVLNTVINVDDILMAKRLADELRVSDHVYHTKFDDSEQLRKNTATIRLDNDIYEELSDKNVMKTLKDIMYETELAQSDREREQEKDDAEFNALLFGRNRRFDQ